MGARFYYIFVVFYLTAVLISAVSLRNADKHTFYKLYITGIEQNRLKQELWQKQLRLENLINPAAISKQIYH
jgi:hypothetical protein